MIVTATDRQKIHSVLLFNCGRYLKYLLIDAKVLNHCYAVILISYNILNIRSSLFLFTNLIYCIVLGTYYMCIMNRVLEATLNWGRNIRIIYGSPIYCIMYVCEGVR